MEQLSRVSPVDAWSEGLEPGAQEAELVSLRICQDVPAFTAGLADITRFRTESEQSLQFGFLIAVGGIDVDVQSELPGSWVAAGIEDESGLRAAESGLGRPDLDASVVLSAQFNVAEDFAPEGGKPVDVGGVDD